MRIATSTIYDNQTTSIDNLSAQYQNVGQQLSTGKSLNVPSDDPSQISQDLTVKSTIAAENADASNANSAQNELTFTDSVLSSLTGLLQTARSLAVEGATDIIPNGSQRPLIGKQIAGLMQQAIGLANSQYGNQYIFAGSGSRTTPPVSPVGSPPTNVTFNGNLNAATTTINGVNVKVGTTMQDGFNLSSTNGTPSVFQLLGTLYQTMTQEPASIESQQPINVTGQVIQGNADANPTTLGQIAAAAPPLTTQALTADSLGNYSIEIDGTNPATGVATSTQFTFTNATAVDAIAGGGAPGVVQQINAQTAATGVTASWNVASQRLQLTSTGPNSPPFMVSDVPSAGAANSSNFLTVFEIPSQVSVTSNLSTQIGDIDAVVNSVMSGRAAIGQQIQNLAGTTSQLQTESTDNTAVQSGYEDTNVAQATSQFTLVQTALQAAYATTTRLEGKTLMDYL